VLVLNRAADEAGKHVYLDLSCINPVFFLPGALKDRAAAWATELFGSCSLGAGQFCTSPGLSFVVAGAETDVFLTEVERAFKDKPAGTLLGAGGPPAIADAGKVLAEHGAHLGVGGKEAGGAGYAFENTWLRVSGDDFAEHAKALQTEAFGSVHLTVIARDAAELVRLAGLLEGNLTGSIYSHSSTDDDALYAELEPALRARVGRLINDKMPTGVAVSPAMQHGGPYPATGHPGFTSVGIPASLTRFAALQAYDGVRASRLPAELRDDNPTGSMWRIIDGQWSQADVT